MRRLFLLIFLVFLSSFCLAQKNVFSITRTYKVEGYILQHQDTVKGYVAIPIDREELDYSSLTKKVVFIDSTEKTKKYGPSDITGFGMNKDDVMSHYISVAKSETLIKNIFLKKVVEGEVMLLAEKLDKAPGYTNKWIRTGYDVKSEYRLMPVYEKEINKSVYYLKIKGGEIKKVPFDSGTASIAKKDLKKLLVRLPDSFADSDEQVDFSSFIKLLENYNSETTSKVD